MNVNIAMSLPGTVRPILQSVEIFDEKNIDPAQVAFAPPTDLPCADCNPVWENGLAA
jgi:hypothetical protein